MKQCTKCKKWKDESEFSKQPRRKDGLRYWCKKCECEYVHKYYRRDRKNVKKYRSYEERHRVVDGVKQKQCGKCKRWKPEDQFYKYPKTKDRLDWSCKKCIKRKYRERRLAVRN